jgi:hypothetical protein
MAHSFSAATKSEFGFDSLPNANDASSTNPDFDDCSLGEGGGGDDDDDGVDEVDTEVDLD